MARLGSLETSIELRWAIFTSGEEGETAIVGAEVGVVSSRQSKQEWRTGGGNSRKAR